MLNACDRPVVERIEHIDLRIATFNVAMGLQAEHQLGQALSHGQDLRLHQLAEILQRVRPDIVLLNEFDYDPTFEAADLFNANFLAVSQNGQQAIEYPYSFRAPVNTGLDSGMDLDNSFYYADDIWSQLRLSSKSHWDLVIDIEGRELHLLAYQSEDTHLELSEDTHHLADVSDHRLVWLDISL
jgi:hypothetical protein